MRVRRPRGPSSERWAVPGYGTVITLILLAAVAGCGSSAAKPTATAAKSTGGSTAPACGTTRTAANVPVNIQVARGQVSCATALQIERDYAKAILSGQVPGTGGGAPVHVQGWTCQGFSTPVVLKTGQASKCVLDGKEILAILPVPS